MSNFKNLDTTGSWYLLHCQKQKEFYVAEALRSRLMVDSYIPQSHIWSRGEKKTVAFFPGYIFIQADLRETALSAINASHGVIRLVEIGGEPCSVPQNVIDEIVISLEKYHQHSSQFFKPGDHVRFRGKGPLQDLDMIFVGPSTSSHRVNVLLNLLGRLKEIQVEGHKLEKIAPRYEQYTHKTDLRHSYSA